MKSRKPACGPQEDVVITDGVRVRRCPCGTVHVTLVRSGVTVQLGPEYLVEVAQALSLAKTILDGVETDHTKAETTALGGGFVTVAVGGPKRSPN